MVKRCGKSAPRLSQGRWQAKPRTEQGQIGRRLTRAAQAARGRKGRPVRSLRVGRLSPSVMPGLEEWLSSAVAGRKARRRWKQNSAYGPLRRTFLRFDPGGLHASRTRSRLSVVLRAALPAVVIAGAAGPAAAGARCSAQRTARPGPRRTRRRRCPDSARRGMPAGHDDDAGVALHDAGVPAAEHRRLPAADDAQVEEHKVPKAKYPVVDSHNHTDRSTPATSSS